MPDRQGWCHEDVRTLFLSDIHLGSKHGQAGALHDFLQGCCPERLYIVGDFIDGWQIQRSSYWKSDSSLILQSVAEMTDRGTEAFYISGNHDDFLRKQPFFRTLMERFGFQRIEEEAVHETVDQRRFLIIHGDQFDRLERQAQWLSRFATHFYDLALTANYWFSRLLGKRNSSPYHLCARIKDRIKRSIHFMSSYQNALLKHARDRQCDGVICGHIHSPAIVQREDLTYCNTGDWVENCTALVERSDGTLEILYFYGGDFVRQVSPPRVFEAAMASAEQERPTFFEDDSPITAVPGLEAEVTAATQAAAASGERDLREVQTSSC